MKIIVSSIYWENFKPIADKTVKEVLKRYCEKHGYEFHDLLVKEPLTGTPYQMSCQAAHKRTEVHLAILSKFKPDYYFSIDTDAVVMNSDIKLESIIEKYPFDIVTGGDKAGSAGNIIIKNTDQAKDYLYEAWLWIQDKRLEHEQTYINQNPKTFIKVTPQRVMNSYDHESRLEQFDKSVHYQEGDFLVHLTGLTIEQRMNVLDKFIARAK